MILHVKSIETYYGTSHILHHASLQVDFGKVVALLGRNGVGKTTTLRSIMGLTPPRSGNIPYKEADVKRNPSHAMARLGLAYIPDDLRIFPDLTCRENLQIAAKLSHQTGYYNLERVEELFPILRSRRKQKGLNLSGGERKMLSLGRALMANPGLILMDEPSEGLAPLIVRSLIDVIHEIQERGMTLLLADQNLKFWRKVCDSGYIIEKGTIVHEDSMEGIWENEAVIKKYLVL